jgi:hypothetical protein
VDLRHLEVGAAGRKGIKELFSRVIAAIHQGLVVVRLASGGEGLGIFQNLA